MCNDIQEDGAQLIAKSLLVCTNTHAQSPPRLFLFVYLPTKSNKQPLLFLSPVCLSHQHNGALVSLRLTGNKIGNKGAMHLASMLQVNTTLQELDIADCDLVVHIHTHDFNTLSHLRHVWFLPTWRRDFDGFFSVFSLSTGNSKCDSVCHYAEQQQEPLFCQRQPTPAFQSAGNHASSLYPLPSLLLTLSSRCLSQDETAVHMSRMLVINQTLRELHLGKMGMSDFGVERLTEALGTNHSLRYLDLRWYANTHIQHTHVIHVHTTSHNLMSSLPEVTA